MGCLDVGIIQGPTLYTRDTLQLLQYNLNINSIFDLYIYLVEYCPT